MVPPLVICIFLHNILFSSRRENHRDDLASNNCDITQAGGPNRGVMMYKVGTNLISRREGDKTYIFNLEEGNIRVLSNRTASRIWELLSEGQKNVDDLAARLCQEFKGATREMCKKDVQAFLENLLDKSLVVKEKKD